MQLHFVDRGLDARVAQNQLQLGDGHVRSADVPHQAHVHQFFHLAPGLHVVLVDVGLGVGAARGHVAARRMEIRKRPMHQVKIQVVEAQIGKRLAAGGDHVVLAVLVVPELRRDPKVFALDSAAENLLNRCADLGLIAVDRSAIEVPVAGRGSALHHLGDLGRADVVGAERAQADGRHSCPTKKSSLRHQRWINRITRRDPTTALLLHFLFLLATTPADQAKNSQ